MTEEADLPEQESRRAEKPEFLTDTRFDQFDLPGQVLSGVADAGFTRCTPIQAQVLPVSLKGHDVAGQAQTGTGKTAAFLVTVLARLLTLPERDANLPAALILAPTRELCRQIFEEAGVLGRYCNFRIAQIVGGVDYKKQADQLREGVDIIICTPGRLIDYYKQGIFKTAGIKVLVIDEADRLLDLGFAKDIRFVLRKLPHYEKRQSMLFSATLSYRVLEMTYEYMNLPEFISITPKETTVEGVEQALFHVGVDRKLQLLLGLLDREEWNRILIFVNTKVGVEWLTDKLKGNGWPAEGISGDLAQRKRFSLMERFKDGKIKILVATDVASRGIHVEDISHVINFDLPQDAENYVHRIGRTARAGKTGRALSLACEEYVYHLEPIEQMLGYKIPVVWFEDDWFVEDTAKPVSIDRRKKLRERVRRRSDRHATGQPVAEKPKRKRFPGAFFGFGPEQPSAPDATEKVADSEDAPKKKRRRPRRKKKPVTPSADTRSQTEIAGETDAEPTQT
jgi:ATP-dependent RNA helicase RhlB